jgi:hypothetical protein
MFPHRTSILMSKGSPVHGMNVYWRLDIEIYSFLNLALDLSGWSQRFIEKKNILPCRE